MSSPGVKNNSLYQKRASRVCLARPAPIRGAYRDRHGRGVAGCDGRFGRAGRARPEADDEDVWSWHPDAGVKFAGDDPASDGG